MTLVEVIVVIAVLGVFVWILLPTLARSRSKSSKVGCVNHLKQIGTAYRVWASDNGDRFPAAVSKAEGGWHDFLTNGNAGPYCWTNYVIMQNELGMTRVLICPQDVRKPATDFNSLSNSNLSYFVGVAASENYPQSILGGDRNLSPGSTRRDDFGFSPKDDRGNDVVIATNTATAYCWSREMHSKASSTGAGNILLADGSVQQLSSTGFGRLQANAAVPTIQNITNSPADPPPPEPGFRLVFP